MPRRHAARLRYTDSAMALNLNKLKLDSVDVAGKRVFIRVDFNVPQDKADPTIITNTARIEGALPSVRLAPLPPRPALSPRAAARPPAPEGSR